MGNNNAKSSLKDAVFSPVKKTKMLTSLGESLLEKFNK